MHLYYKILFNIKHVFLSKLQIQFDEPLYSCTPVSGGSWYGAQKHVNHPKNSYKK